MGHRRYCRRKLPIQTAVCAEIPVSAPESIPLPARDRNTRAAALAVRPHRKSGTRSIHRFFKETPATMIERMDSHGVRAC